MIKKKFELHTQVRIQAVSWERRTFYQNMKLKLFINHYESPCIWLELTKTYIPIRRMSPKRLHSRTSNALSVNRNCMGFFVSG